MPTYKSENVQIDYYSFIKPEMAEKLIGKQIAQVCAEEYSLELIFTDGSKLKVSGSGRDYAPLGVSLKESERL